MDPKQISSLAKLLRDSGDKILNSDFTFTLSGHLLRALNDSFTLIADRNELISPMSFQVVKPNNSKSEVFRDLQLVHDFVQKTLNLCVARFSGDDLFEGTIDINKFRSLRRLEVQKVNIKQITGILLLRAQLQHLTCVRSIECIEDIITYCGGDQSNGFVWNELKSADFSYNNLRTVDSSLEFAQWLQTLNLSHNQLVSVDAVKWLPNLKMLDLSYNRLVHIPAFHNEASRRLQILILNSNFIEDLNGISRLDTLSELHLSDNSLLDHSFLLPISTLVSLRYINLHDNPLFYHPKHRETTARYLHKNTTSMKFILDSEPLANSEKRLVGGIQSYNSILSSRLSYSTRSSVQSTPGRTPQSDTPASSVGSGRSYRLTDQYSNEMNASMNEKQKKLKVRTVEIEDPNTSKQANTTKELTEKVPEANKDHLETKRQIDDLRAKFGSEWLQSENATLVQSVLGIKETDSISTKRISSQQFIDDLLGSMNGSKHLKNSLTTDEKISSTGLTSTPIAKDRVFDLNIASPIKSVNSPISSDTDTLYESVATKSSEEKNNTTLYKSVQEEASSSETNLDNIYRVGNDDSEISEPDDCELTYIVYQFDHNDELLLAISDTYIKERDILTLRTKTKWSLKMLESCERVKANTIRMNFDTIKKDKKERTYTVEEGPCQELEKYLRGILSKRLLSEMNQTLYKCVKCSMQFSRENTYKKPNIDVYCPECKSIFVVELHEPSNSFTKNTLLKYEELPVVINNAVPSTSSTTISTTATTSSTTGPQSSGEKYIIEESASHSSIGSAGSLNESSSCSKISNSENSFDSNQSVAGSSTNDRDIDFNFSKNGESDIEILSNPSQSSIEVLDTMHSSRKPSEERRISQIPSLDTIEDNSYNSVPGMSAIISGETLTDFRLEITKPTNESTIVAGSEKKSLLGHVHLTESSSSGSITDSVCTAYEQDEKSSASANTPELKAPQLKAQHDKEFKREDSIISSMFGGLFQSTNILMSRSQKQNDSITCDKFKFSYTDFSDADHRIKLHLYQNVFEDSNEHFKWLVKGKIYNEATGDLFEGIMVMSTTRFYIMEIYGHERDDIVKWLKRISSVTVDRVESVELLPWKIGLSFTLKGLSTFLILLQDILRTDSLLLFFSNNPLPDDCNLGYQISEKLLKKISYFTNDEQLKMISILNKCEITSDNLQKTLIPTGFFATDTHLYLTTSNFSWLLSNSDASLELAHIQMMNNLVEVERPEKNIFAISFLDEDQNKCELWKCNFDTEDNAESCLNAIGQSWEKLFGVGLSCN